MSKITKNFTWKEITASNTAKTKGIKNEPGDLERKSLVYLFENLIQPLRDAYGKAMIITSGYRCKELNAAVGGSATSQHMKGEAVDITCDNIDDLLNVLRDKDFNFDQCIKYPKKNIVHLSLKYNRNQYLEK